MEKKEKEISIGLGKEECPDLRLWEYHAEKFRTVLLSRVPDLYVLYGSYYFMPNPYNEGYVGTLSNAKKLEDKIEEINAPIINVRLFIGLKEQATAPYVITQTYIFRGAMSIIDVVSLQFMNDQGPIIDHRDLLDIYLSNVVKSSFDKKLEDIAWRYGGISSRYIIGGGYASLEKSRSGNYIIIFRDKSSEFLDSFFSYPVNSIAAFLFSNLPNTSNVIFVSDQLNSRGKEYISWVLDIMGKYALNEDFYRRLLEETVNKENEVRPDYVHLMKNPIIIMEIVDNVLGQGHEIKALTINERTDLIFYFWKNRELNYKNYNKAPKQLHPN